MKYRKFGKTGFNVSALGLGCMRLPTMRLLPQKLNTKKAVGLIRYAMDNGINYLDTAWPYHFGGSERVTGLALQDGYRDKAHLVTKLFMPLVRKTADFDTFLDGQLKKLQVDCIDTYLFHALNKKYFQKVKDLGLMEKMLRARDAGKIKHIGFSFHDTLPVFKEIVDYHEWDVAQIQYNYMDTAIQATEQGLKYAGAKGMAIVIMEPLRGGTLANPPKAAKDVIATAPVKRTPVDWALQYLWNLPEVSVVISGMGTERMVHENCASADKSGAGSLTGADQDTINALVEIYNKNLKVPCTACQYCMNCPSGVNIPQNFAVLNNTAMKGVGPFGWMITRSYKKLAKKPAKLNRNKTNGNASLCTECGVCVPKCPQGITIPEELKKVDAVLGRGKKLESVFG